MEENKVNTLSSTDSPAYTTLNEVVAGVRMRKRDRTHQNDKVYLQYAIDGLREFNFSDPTNIKTWKIRMDKASRSISMPVDMTDYTKIAAMINGCIWTLSVNNAMEIPTTQKCGIPIRDICNNNYNQEDVPTENLAFFGGYWGENGGWSSGFYGAGGGFNRMYYRVDRRNRMIYFDGDLPVCDIYIEGLTDGLNMCGDTVVETIMLDYLRNYILFQEELNSNKITQYLLEKRQQQLDESKSVLEWRTFRKNFSLYELMDGMREVWSPGLHR
jgi:hypothetical protein